VQEGGEKDERNKTGTNNSAAPVIKEAAAEQKYPIKISCGAAANVVRKIMGWANDASWNVPGAIFADEGVIIYSLEQAFAPAPKGGWATRRMNEARHAERVDGAVDNED
jgi:hypothetical protein